MVTPENIEVDNAGETRANPNRYEGTRWRFTADNRGNYELNLHAESGEGMDLELTPEQAAKVLYAAQAGELDDYGDYLK